MVTVFWWNKGQDGRRWNVKKYYHLEYEGEHCWENQGLDYLKLNPYVPYVRKKSMLLSPEDKRKRLLILKRKASLNQDLRELDVTATGYAERFTSIEAKKAQLMLEILPYGGIPKSWTEELLR